MRTVALASGSNGNAIHVETTGARLLFDAGLPARALAARAEAVGVDLDRVDALILSHNHWDHSSGAGVAHRRFGMPVMATTGTWSAVAHRVGKVREARTFRAGETLSFGTTRVETIPTPHDGRDGVAFVVEDGGTRLGVLTDLGHPFERLREAVSTLDGAYLEANYDARMLWSGPYPHYLKERIAGPGGHLSNRECVELVEEAGERLRLLVLCHLSGENNSPEVALRAAGSLASAGVEVRIAGRNGPAKPVRL
ncbi:MAG: MBL fold metallo-hydrolase [Planctomycetota bacterium]